MKNLILNKSNNIIKKIKGCFECHKILKNKIIKINDKNIKKNYKELNNFKLNLKYNINMSNIINGLNNKYIIEICKYLKNFPNIIKKIKIKKW